MKYLKVVQNASDIVDVVVPSVYYIKDTEEVKYYGGPEFVPLTFIAREDDFSIALSSPCSYSLDNIHWSDLAENTATPTVPQGGKIYVRKETQSGSVGTFTTSKMCDVEGNVMSMVYGELFIEKKVMRCKFESLFSNCSIVNAGDLVLPATTLIGNCYSSMFYGCARLTQAPHELPATTLTYNCYSNMFRRCTSLTQAPELPATTLGENCYGEMFADCTSLTKAPHELPATTLASRCYDYMFRRCTSLTQAPELPATTLALECYHYMFEECTSLTKAPELPATTLASECYSSMFRKCTSLTKAPELPATTLASECYSYMFYGCTSLARIVMLATDLSASLSLSNWVGSVATSGTFVKAAGVTIPSGTSGIPEGWTVEER